MKLAELVDTFVPGDWGNESYSDETPNAIRCIRGADIVPILETNYSKIPVRFVSNNSLQKKRLQVGDIVIEKSGGSPTQSTGRAVLVTEELIEVCPDLLCTNFCVAIRPNKNWDASFIFWLWQNLYDSDVFFNFEGKTSGIKNLQLEIALASIDIDEKPISIQKAISNVLSTIDRKIAVNRSINHNLEALAKMLYDYWFVQFDFPDANGRPYKSSDGEMAWNERLKRKIPKGWHCGTLLDIAVYTNGLACQKFRPSDERKLPVIKIKEMHDGLSTETEFVKADIPDAVKVYNGDVLFSWSASLEVMLWANGNGGLNQHIFKVTPKNGYPRSFYYYQLVDYICNFKRMADARKTTMGHITQDHLQQSTIALPPTTDLPNALEQQLCPIFNAIVENAREVSSLTTQRDTLLPLLMNGQVSVNYDLSPC